MLLMRLAFRNILGRGLRTWLNVFVLSFAFVIIVWTKGLIEGWSRDSMNAMIDSEIGGGQFCHSAYDPYDPLTLEDSHAPLSTALEDLVTRGEATPVLITSGAIFPDGRVQSVVLKGADPRQKIINLPVKDLATSESGAIPAMIGTRMADQAHLRIGDYVTVRWRDINGTFDADDIQITHIMSTMVPTIDQGQIWIPIDKLRDMMQAPGEASLVVLKKEIQQVPPGNATWIHRDHDYLLREFREMIRMKSGGINVIYGLLLFMGLLAVFDTQVLAVWRRRREIGTLMALGMDRVKIVGLFTIEGALHGFLALIVGAIYGVPLMALTLSKGIPMPEMVSDVGISIPQRLYPSYGLELVMGTTILVLIAVTFVSFLPVAKLSKLKPTEALRGRTS